MRKQHSTVWSRQIVQNIAGRRSNPEVQPGEVEPPGCCVDTDALLVVCPDVTHPWHRAQVNTIETINDKGLVTLSFVDASGAEHNARLPMCSAPEEGECCFDAVNGVILCNDPKHPAHNKPASLVDDLGNGYVYVCGALDPNSSAPTCARMPLCPDQPPDGCCYDATTGAIVCDNEVFPHGLMPQLIKQGVDDKGKGYVVVQDPQLNDGNRTLLYLCPEQPPVECCFDVASGKLSCPGSTFDGLEVSLEHMTDVMEDGNIYAVVSHPDLPGGVGQFLLCDQEVPDDCCYDGEKKVLRCPNSPLDGTQAGVVAQLDVEGESWVSVAWSGGAARMPLCTPECPPVYCCVNTRTGLFVCPGEPALNNQPADLLGVDVVDGISFAVLSDDTRLPVCGSECPPPELCPDGMWMSPDKECLDLTPWGEPCPPGMWRDPDGICRMPPECPECPNYKPGDCPNCASHGQKWWFMEGSCCESCALGLPCGGGCGDCDCGEKKHANPTTPAGMWYAGSYTKQAPVKQRPWVQLFLGKKIGVLHIPNEPHRGYKVRVLEMHKDGTSKYKVRVRAITKKQKPLRAHVMGHRRGLGSGMLTRDHQGACTKADIDAGGCYSTTNDRCYVPCGIEGSVTAAPGKQRDHQGACTDADIKAGGCYSTTNDRCYVPCGFEGSITAPSAKQARVQPWAI